MSAPDDKESFDFRLLLPDILCLASSSFQLTAAHFLRRSYCSHLLRNHQGFCHFVSGLKCKPNERTIRSNHATDTPLSVMT